MIDIALVHFRAVDLRYLEAALYSVLTQSDLLQVQTVYIYDNDSADSVSVIRRLVDTMVEADVPPSHLNIELLFDKHGDETRRCQSYSVNQVMGVTGTLTSNDWVLFTRSDYILHRDTVRDFTAAVEGGPLNGWRGFVTSHAYHHALDARADQRIEGFRDIEQHGWRTHPQSTDVLLEKVNGWRVDSSDKDAGVWLTRRSLWREVGGLNPNLTAWGYQQTVFQKALREAGVAMVQLPRVYFHHQHHGGTFRDYDEARRQLEAHWGTLEDLQTFRPDVVHHKGRVCDELDRG